MYYDNHTAKMCNRYTKEKGIKVYHYENHHMMKKDSMKGRHYKTERKQDGKNKPSLSINNYLKYKLIKFSKDREWLNG